MQITAQKTNTGKIIFEITINGPYANLRVYAFNPSNGDKFQLTSSFKNGSIITTITFDSEMIIQTDFITLSMYMPGSSASYFFITSSSLNALKKLAAG